jgi:HD-GYP domain-containing protein (c-di-GMP phosphodiesterase class II)
MINGGGYPNRHFQRECHKASKLVHICDVYDALRTTRPYREAWEPDRILQQIEKGIGWDFDEDVSRAFIQMMGQWESRVAVVDDKTALPQYAAAMLEANRENTAAAVSAAASAAASADAPADAPPPAAVPAVPDSPLAPSP